MLRGGFISDYVVSDDTSIAFCRIDGRNYYRSAAHALRRRSCLITIAFKLVD